MRCVPTGLPQDRFTSAASEMPARRNKKRIGTFSWTVRTNNGQVASSAPYVTQNQLRAQKGDDHESSPDCARPDTGPRRNIICPSLEQPGKDGSPTSSIRNVGGIDFIPAFRPLRFLFATARSRRDSSLRAAGSHLEFRFQERMRQHPSRRGLCRANRHAEFRVNKEINAAPADRKIQEA